MSEIALKIENLSKIYPGDLVALNNISLEVKKGDFYALLGPNGAGKSTTIGIISSLVTKTSGLVELMGIDIDVNHARLKKIMALLVRKLISISLKMFCKFSSNKLVTLACPEK